MATAGEAMGRHHLQGQAETRSGGDGGGAAAEPVAVVTRPYAAVAPPD